MVLAVIVAWLLLSVTSDALVASEVICRQERVKPVRHICGIVIDQSGAPVAHVKVTILKGETKLVAVETGENGKFSFDGLRRAAMTFGLRKRVFILFDFRLSW